MKKIAIISALVLTGGILFAQEQVQRKQATSREQREAPEVKAEKVIVGLDNDVQLSKEQSAALFNRMKTQEVQSTAELKATNVLSEAQIEKIEAKDAAKVEQMKKRPSRGDQKSAPANR